jgi:hypothetical protein
MVFLGGWTALIWAINGRQSDIVELLLDKGAEKCTITKQGRTVFQFDTSNAIKKLLGSPATSSPKQKITKNSPIISPTTPVPELKRSKSIILANEMDYYHRSTDYSHFFNYHLGATHSAPSKLPISPPDLSQLNQLAPSPQQEQLLKETDAAASNMEMTEEEEEDMKRWEASIKSSSTFSWDRCLPDQMFVFSLSDMNLVVEHALQVSNVGNLRNESGLSSALWQPANIIFLCARYAHYCSTREVLSLLLSTVSAKLLRILKVRLLISLLVSFDSHFPLRLLAAKQKRWHTG